MTRRAHLRAHKRDYEARFHRKAWTSLIRLSKWSFKEGMTHYKKVPLTHLYVSDYDLPREVIMHSGYYPGD